jgi:hypothetical protein
LGTIELDSIDHVLLPAYLEKNDKKFDLFISGFVWGRFWTKRWPWVDGIINDDWTIEQKNAFLILLPFTQDTWRRAKQLLNDNVMLYWKKAKANPYDSQDQDQLLGAIENLIEYGRPGAALNCLRKLVYEKRTFSPDIGLRVLMGIATTNKEDDPTHLDSYDLVELINWLQNNPQTDSKRLLEIEWAFLPLLDRHHGGIPKTIERHLSVDPKFFCEVLRVIYRSDKQEPVNVTLTEQEKGKVQRAYQLLDGWEIAPGTVEGGAFDGAAFNKWLEEVKKDTADSGHLRVAMSKVGEVLAYAPADPDDLWIHHSVAEALNNKDAEVMRSGFTRELYNGRGIFTPSGGKEELEIAAGYHQKADALEQRGYQRFAAAIREFAKSYERDAKQDVMKDIFES